MNSSTITFLVILAIFVVALIALYNFGKKVQDRQAENQKMLDASAQQVTLLVIDKAKMRFMDANFPASVVENAPKRLRRSKVYVVKAKIGPRITSLLCDLDVYNMIPVKKDVKATVSGLYITDVKGIRGSLEMPKKKKGLLAKLTGKN